MWHRISKTNSMLYAKKALFSTCAPAALHGAGEWASHNQRSRHCAYGNGGSFVVFCACAGDKTSALLITKRTRVIVARQLKKHNQPRVHTLAMRRDSVAAWQMVSCPSDAKGRRHWEEPVDMALRRNVEKRIHQTVQGRQSEQHAVETPSPRQTDLLGATFHAIHV